MVSDYVVWSSRLCVSIFWTLPLTWDQHSLGIVTCLVIQAWKRSLLDPFSLSLTFASSAPQNLLNQPWQRLLLTLFLPLLPLLSSGSLHLPWKAPTILSHLLSLVFLYLCILCSSRVRFQMCKSVYAMSLSLRPFNDVFIKGKIQNLLHELKDRDGTR